MNDDIFEAVILLAQVDAIYRAGIIDKNLGKVDKEDMKDLKNLISPVKPELFKAKKICILNPIFGEVFQLMGGADCDLVIDETLWRLKQLKDLHCHGIILIS